ncbi:MAG TPA: TilS substrate-binding domain-containing protein, partial [Pyrinomonadaceae bacterium]
LLRGSGADGLGGMAAERALDEGRVGVAGGGGEVFLRRPLLAWARRADTEGYCRARGVEPRADEMNDDEAYSRVPVRRRLLPLLETFNPRASEALARAAGLLREDSAALDALAAALLEEARGGAEVSGEGRVEALDGGAWPLRVGALAAASAAVRRRALRLWLARGRGDLRRISHAHLLGVERLCEGERGGRTAELPGGSSVERRRGLLLFRRGT